LMGYGGRLGRWCREKEERILVLNLERERVLKMKENWPLWP
jgi:hypothetical protein